MVAVLAGYCLIMVVPAVLLLGVRVAFPARVEPLLNRLNTWITEKSGSMLGWVLGIAGFLLARDALARLELFA
ncbi:GAP family protein [Micromonospora musae]|uniref:GAP family protein n=1 Tax=Micromonospora musae TaxID=1894970 RepID=UPI003425A788